MSSEQIPDQITLQMADGSTKSISILIEPNKPRNVLYWLFTELPTDIFIRAVKNIWEQDPDDVKLYHECDNFRQSIIQTFNWGNTDEYVQYWGLVAQKQFDKARQILAESDK